MNEVFAMAHRVRGAGIVRHHGIDGAGPRQTRAGQEERYGEQDAPTDRPSAHRDRLSKAEAARASATHPHACPPGLYRSALYLKVA
jgi:hypothetical protein